MSDGPAPVTNNSPGIAEIFKLILPPAAARSYKAKELFGERVTDAARSPVPSLTVRPVEAPPF
jgi:hypothetical protein